MASLKTLLRETVGQLVFKELVVDGVREVSPHFRQLRVSGESLRNGRCAAGDKLQIMIADGGPRTYTPFAHDAAAGRLELLAFVHGDTPAARWARQLQAGARFRAFGPRGSLPLATINGPVVLFGDETSFAVAKALRDLRGAGDGLAFVFESSAREEAELVLRELGLAGASVIARRSAHAHLDEVDGQLRAALSRMPSAQLVLTGHAQSIQGIRARLKARPAGNGSQRSKAYWADGKAGLD